MTIYLHDRAAVTARIFGPQSDLRERRGAVRKLTAGCYPLAPLAQEPGPLGLARGAPVRHERGSDGAGGRVIVFQ